MKSHGHFCDHPWFKTGLKLQNWSVLTHKYTTDFDPLQNWSPKLVNTYVTPVTQISGPLPTRRTKWYNGWYNNHLRDS